MAYEAIPFNQPAGLNLRDSPDEVGADGAIDLLNVDFDIQGAVRQRDGYDNFTSPALTNNVGSLHSFYTTAGTVQLIAGCGTRLEAINTSGVVVASQTGLSTGTWDFARFGAPGSEYIYAGQGTDLLHRWDGTTWSSIASTPRAGALAVMATDLGNRLVAGRFNTTTGGPTGGAGTSSPSHVYFSGPGTPEVWGTPDFQVLTPGDGEKVQAIIAWREFIFVFKETKYFVFYGTSLGAAGQAVFNYRTVDTGVGLVSPRAVCVGPHAVYFMARDGIYQTVGGDAEKISSILDPIWLSGASSFYLGGVLAHTYTTNSALTYCRGRLVLAFTSGASATNNRMLVYDPRADWWSLWDVAATSVESFRIGTTEELVFGYPAANHVGRQNSAYLTDDGTTVTSRVRSGFYDLGIEAEKTIRETLLWGVGTVGVALSRDFGALDTATTVTLGSAPAITGSRVRKAKRGTVFSQQLSSVSGAAWTVHRLVQHVRESRATGIKTTA